MATMVDARGLACPHPVIQTRKAMQEDDQVVTLVDNETAVANVSRMAKKAGWQVGVTPEGARRSSFSTPASSWPARARRFWTTCAPWKPRASRCWPVAPAWTT